MLRKPEMLATAGLNSSCLDPGGFKSYNSMARVVSDRVREIAAWHPNGYVFTTDGVVLDEVFWSNTPVVTMDHLLREGRAFIALPCTVDYFG